MAAWTQSINLTEPAGLGDPATGIGSLATAANATLDAAQTALDAVKLFLVGAVAPEAV